jgi:Flp pilus assembly protein TadG
MSPRYLCMLIFFCLGRHQGGGIATTFACLIPVLLGLTALAIDSTSFHNQRSRMQTVADATALAAAKELLLFTDDLSPLKASTQKQAEALLREVGLASHPHTTAITLDAKQATADVQIVMETDTFLPADVWGETPIKVSAKAQVYGTVRLCVLSLKDKNKHVLTMEHGARVTAPECAVQANSKHPKGLSAKAASLLVSSFTCSSGGYEGPGSAFLPVPETDCPALDDPLAMRAPPPISGCDYLDTEIKTGTHRLQPGHYCGGIKIEKDAQVLVDPGIYVISGGKLEVKDKAAFKGEYVSFYFADDDAKFEFKDEAIVELSGANEGSLAGVLFFENRAAKADREFKISSDSVSKLIGTIYLPRGIFKASATEDDMLPVPGAPLEVIGAASTYTIIVANQIRLDGVNLVINADYGATNVPVPAGLGPNSATVQLSQ